MSCQFSFSLHSKKKNLAPCIFLKPTTQFSITLLPHPSKYNKTQKNPNTQFDFTFKDSNPLISSAEASDSEPKEKQPKWCHLVMSKARASRVTKPNLRVFESMVLEHFLQAERFDFAYSATILVEGGIVWLGE